MIEGQWGGAGGAICEDHLDKCALGPWNVKSAIDRVKNPSPFVVSRRTRRILTHPSLYGPQHGFTPNCATCAHKARIFASASSPGGGGGGGEASGFIAGKSSTSRIEFLFVRNIVNLSIPVWKSTSASGATRQFFTKSFLGDDAAVLARSSGEEPASPRHRAGVVSMAWRTTRRFSTNAP